MDTLIPRLVPTRAALWTSWTSCLFFATATVRPACQSAAPELEHFEVRIETFDAPSILQGSAQYVIYLPKGWQKDDATGAPATASRPAAAGAPAAPRYPLAVWLHGMNGNYRRFHDNGGPETLDKLRADGAIDDLVFVAVNAARRPVYVDGQKSGDYGKFIAEDLLAHLEQTYPVARDAAHRAIMGVSIGGMGALSLALTTEAFGTVAAHSACILPATLEEVTGRSARRLRRMAQGIGLGDVLTDPAKWAKVSPMALVRDATDERLAALNIYFDAGSRDRYGFGPANEALHALLDQREVEHSFELVPDGGHAWGSGSTQRQLPKSLAFVGAAFRGQGPATAAPASRPAAAASGDEPAPQRGADALDGEKDR